MKEGYEKGLWLDRKDNDGIYCKCNCKWSTPSEQQRNKRSNRWFEKNGIRMIVTDWAKFFGVSYSTLFCRVRKNTFDEVHDHYTNNPKHSKIKNPI